MEKKVWNVFGWGIAVGAADGRTPTTSPPRHAAMELSSPPLRITHALQQGPEFVYTC